MNIKDRNIKKKTLLLFIISDMNSLTNIKKINIFFTWEKIFKKKMWTVLIKHISLFKSELEKFEDNNSILIFFKNKLNFNDLKRFIFKLSLKNWATIDKILNKLKFMKYIKFVSLILIYLIIILIFVVWKNKKSRVIIHFR